MTRTWKRSGWFCRHPRLVGLACTFAVVWSCLSGKTTSLAAEPATETTADRLVSLAIEAESQGDLSARATALRGAVQISPDNKLARWQLGHVEIDGKWTTIDEAQQAAAASPRVKAYLALRRTLSDSVDDQLTLARFCDSKHLEDEARFHWTNVLSADPDQLEAQRALGVHWHNGRLMTRQQIADSRKQDGAAAAALRKGKTLVAKWERDFDSDLATRTAVLNEVRSLNDPAALPAFEEATLSSQLSTDLQTIRCRLLSLALLDALDGMSDPAATASLTKHAVLSPLANVRAEAVTRLKTRSMHDYVPLLLDGLASPIKSWFGVVTDPNGSVHYRHALYREGPFADWSLLANRSAWRLPSATEDVSAQSAAEPLLTPVQPTRLGNTLRRGITRNVQNFTSQFGRQASETEQQVTQVNASDDRINKLIVPVLAETTGQSLGSEPTEWWRWWQDYNGYESSQPKPVNSYTYDDYQTYTVPVPISIGSGGGGSTECFTRGTPVWTKTGLRPNETIRMGNLVLAQNVETGELAYKPVVGTTTRPPSPLVTLSVGSERITATLGHPFWVAGKGWQMAKQVTDGAVLHGAKQPVCVTATMPAGDAPAFNLVVADFATYFVGEAGVLVHDNTMNRSTSGSALGLAVK